ncbi:MAG: nucleoside hydrolase [Oscillospiraceae bacterium]|nr:nucleoside hydrolase [Oscillospiraceae bacterium]
MSIPLIIDCDNTMGVAGCDVDDGLALLYVLGSPEVELLGITCAYGNNKQDVVYENTKRLLKLWGREDIPFFRGSSTPGELDSEAADFIAKMAEKYAGELKLLVLGSTTNICGAAKKCAGFWDKVKAISFMGGITEELIVGGKPMAELNLSIDWRSSLEILRNAKNISIATAQNCLASYFKKSEFLEFAGKNPGALADYLRSELEYWYDIHESHWNLDGIVNWDVMAAVQLICPEYFDLNESIISPHEDSFHTGLLLAGGKEIRVCLPVIKDREEYIRHVYGRYFAAKVF